MGQYDLETDAALAQLNYEELATTPGGEFAEIIGDLLMLVGTGGLWAVAGGASNLLLKVRRLAGASYASNLIYAITAVRNDLKTLYERHAELHERIESLRNDPKFAEAIAALALRVMLTSVKDRLNRLARIVVNGVKERDLELESLDDMMRAAVELTEHDISVLKSIYEMQLYFFTPVEMSKPYNLRIDAIRHEWKRWWEHDGAAYLRDGGAAFRSSTVRIQSAGLIASIGSPSRLHAPVINDFELLIEGKKFYERIQEIAAGD